MIDSRTGFHFILGFSFVVLAITQFPICSCLLACSAFVLHVSRTNFTVQVNGVHYREIENFKKKKSLLSSRIKKINPLNSSLISVTRINIFLDSTRAITRMMKRNLLTDLKLTVHFNNESGMDLGGLTREWFMAVSKNICEDKRNLLFVISDSDHVSCQLNPQFSPVPKVNPIKTIIETVTRFIRLNVFRDHASQEQASPSQNMITVIPNRMEQYRVFGAILGLAVYNSQHMNLVFSRIFLKQFKSIEITREDMMIEDPQFYTSLLSLLNMDLNDGSLDLTFSTTEAVVIAGGKEFHETIELIPNGMQIMVTNDNKHEYVNMLLKYKYIDRLKPFMDAIREGFEEVMPLSFLSDFTLFELQLLFGGLPYIDIKDWKSNTVYKGGYSVYSQSIIWFWNIVESLDQHECGLLLKFVTGSCRVPPTGFAHLRGSTGDHLFTISRYRKVDCKIHNYLPQSHTCFNTLNWPEYSNYDIARKQLLLAIQDSDSFEQI
jgi:hypothetical protein